MTKKVRIVKQPDGTFKAIRPRDQVRAIPGWATWDEDTTLAWVQTNITDQLPVANLAEANAVLEKMETWMRAVSRMVVAMRDEQWPELGD